MPIHLFCYSAQVMQILKRGKAKFPIPVIQENAWWAWEEYKEEKEGNFSFLGSGTRHANPERRISQVQPSHDLAHTILGWGEVTRRTTNHSTLPVSQRVDLTKNATLTIDYNYLEELLDLVPEGELPNEKGIEWHQMWQEKQKVFDKTKMDNLPENSHWRI